MATAYTSSKDYSLLSGRSAYIMGKSSHISRKNSTMLDHHAISLFITPPPVCVSTGEGKIPKRLLTLNPRSNKPGQLSISNLEKEKPSSKIIVHIGGERTSRE
ncbi:hypothetical protein VNO77_29741 [Canavalia gladiata]|uniref:Uncharacterized protein n=1 Tax=Canavalia gladiata TaxID=3824 RepID=A0AAN9KNS3_CANGL